MLYIYSVLFRNIIFCISQVIDAFLAILAKRNPGIALMLPSQLPVKWRRDGVNDWKFEKVTRSIVPIP